MKRKAWKSALLVVVLDGDAGVLAIAADHLGGVLVAEAREDQIAGSEAGQPGRQVVEHPVEDRLVVRPAVLGVPGAEPDDLVGKIELRRLELAEFRAPDAAPGREHAEDRALSAVDGLDGALRRERLPDHGAGLVGGERLALIAAIAFHVIEGERL